MSAMGLPMGRSASCAVRFLKGLDAVQVRQPGDRAQLRHDAQGLCAGRVADQVCLCFWVCSEAQTAVHIMRGWCASPMCGKGICTLQRGPGPACLQLSNSSVRASVLVKHAVTEYLWLWHFPVQAVISGAGAANTVAGAHRVHLWGPHQRGLRKRRMVLEGALFREYFKKVEA